MPRADLRYFLVMATDPLPDPNTPFGTHVRTRLAESKVIWLTTVGRDGTPQPNPVWFLWTPADAARILVYNRPDANRLAHVKARSRLALNLDGNGAGGDIVVATGAAEIVEDAPLATENPDYLAKYAADAVRVSGSAEKFAQDYPVLLRITLDRVRGH